MEISQLLLIIILGIIGVVPTVSKDNIVQLVGMLINVLVAFGIVADPTTPGVSDHSYSNADNANGFDEDTDFSKEAK
jgi:uncharacterized membrane protein